MNTEQLSLDGDFIAETVSETKTIVSWQKNVQFLPLLGNLASTQVRKNCEPHRYVVAFPLSTKAYLIISEQQNPSFSAHCHFQRPMMEIKLSNSSRIRLLS